MFVDRSQSDEARRLRNEILAKTRDYFAAAYTERPFDPDSDPSAVAGRVFDASDIETLVDSSLDFWLTTGRYAERFERDFARWFGTRECVLVNSGSSANLLALTMTSSSQLGERRLRPGDEVITAAAGFPTTVNPIIQVGAIPVFVDSELLTYNADLDAVERALSPRTKAVMLAHTLGNPYDAARVQAFCRKHGLWMIEDTCDAVGAMWQGRQVGTYGDAATVSFYPAHHITMGEGGAVLMQSPLLRKICESFRDWGRDCWCQPGRDNTCGKRFAWKSGDLPYGYDHKYTYGHIGYNLKLTDMQAAVGVAQLAKLDGFVAARRANAALYDALLSDVAWLARPQITNGAEPSWFGYPLRVLPGAPITRDELIGMLNEARVGTRLLFGGNLVKQPAYRDVRMRIAGDLSNANTIMRDVFWVGTYPGLGEDQIRHIAATIVRAGKQRPSAPAPAMAKP